MNPAALRKFYLPTLILILISAGVSHFFAPQEFAPAIPDEIPYPMFWVYFTGAAELLAVIGLLLPRFRKLTAYALIFYFIAILPAHFEMLIKAHEIFGLYDQKLFILRVFMQLILIWLSWELRYSNQKSIVPILDTIDLKLKERWSQPFAWHSKWLWWAAFYNIAFGYWVVIYPNQAFELFNMTPPTYPFVWQSVGMIVGVYGIGYGFAAFNEQRNWLIVFVGWLGKIFGPVGFIYTYMNGEIALIFGTILIFNDLIWYPSFFGIMIRRFKKGNLLE